METAGWDRIRISEAGAKSWGLMVPRPGPETLLEIGVRISSSTKPDRKAPDSLELRSRQGLCSGALCPGSRNLDEVEM